MSISTADKDELVRISRRYGADPTIILAGGGNTSVKSEEIMLVKASGHAMATIDIDGFVELDRRKLSDVLRAKFPGEPKARESQFVSMIMAARTKPELGQRPSVEALLHHLLPGKFVVHTHASAINAFTCCVKGEALARDVFGDEFIWIPYVDPGLVLARAIEAKIKIAPARPVTVLLLQNHGLVVAADSMALIEAEMARLLQRAGERLKPISAVPASGSIAEYADAAKRLWPQKAAAVNDSAAVRSLVSNREVLAEAMGGPLTPDQIVYCGSCPVVLAGSTAIEEELTTTCRAYQQQYGREPWVYLIPFVGLLTVRDSEKMARITSDVYADAAGLYLHAANLGGIKKLDRREREFIEEWEVESFRRAVAAGGSKT